MELGPARALGAGLIHGQRVHPRNKHENLQSFGAHRVPYLEVSAMALGAGASHGPRVHPMNKRENLEGFGAQSVPYFEVHPGARPAMLGPARALGVGATGASQA